MKLVDIFPPRNTIDLEFLESVEALVNELNVADVQREWGFSSNFQEAKEAAIKGDPRSTTNDLDDLKLLTFKVGAGAGRASIQSARIRLNRIKFEKARATANITSGVISQTIGTVKSSSTAEAKTLSAEEQQIKLLSIVADNTTELIQLNARHGEQMIYLLKEGSKETKAVVRLTWVITALTLVLALIAVLPLVKSAFTPFAPYEVFWQKSVLLGLLLLMVITLWRIVFLRLSRAKNHEQ